MEQTVVRQGMALDEYIRRMDEAPFEIINGEIILVSPSIAESGDIAWIFMNLLFPVVTSNRLGSLFVESTFVLPGPDNSKWVTGSRKPDLMLFSGERYPDYKLANPGWRKRPVALVPDLVVEIVSPTDRMVNVLKKIALYLEDGVQAVWVVEPENQVVMVYTLMAIPLILSGDQILTGGELLPGFSTPIHALFED